MSVIPLTVFFSLLLAGTFVLLFAREQRRRHLTSPERDSLLPLADETPVTAGGARASLGLDPTAHAHDHGRCGCRDGARPPCAGCLRSRDEQDPDHF